MWDRGKIENVPHEVIKIKIISTAVRLAAKEVPQFL